MSTPEVIITSEDGYDVIEVVAQGPAGPAGTDGAQGNPGASEYYIAAQNVGGHAVVTLDANGEVILADASTPGHQFAIGLTKNAAITGDTVVTQVTGRVEHLGWTFAPDAPVFLGLNGALTQTVPGGAIFCKPLGVAISATRVNLSFQPAIFF
jgi:hypothetical protein